MTPYGYDGPSDPNLSVEALGLDPADFEIPEAIEAMKDDPREWVFYTALAKGVVKVSPDYSLITVLPNGIAVFGARRSSPYEIARDEWAKDREEQIRKAMIARQTVQNAAKGEGAPAPSNVTDFAKVLEDALADDKE